MENELKIYHFYHLEDRLFFFKYFVVRSECLEVALVNVLKICVLYHGCPASPNMPADKVFKSVYCGAEF